MARLRSELETTLASVRGALGLSQEQLAHAVQVSRQTIGAIEAGSYSPSTVLALRLSVVLDRSIHDLFRLPEASVADLLPSQQLVQEQQFKRRQGFLLSDSHIDPHEA